MIDAHATTCPREGAIYHRYLDDGWEVTVYRMAFNYRVCLGRVESLSYEDAYCYRDRATALAAAASWDGHGPIMGGWHKNPCTGERRPET